MTERLKLIPAWGQLLLALIGLIVGASLSYAAMRSDLRAETIERKDADVLIEKTLQIKLDSIHEDVKETKDLLKEHMRGMNKK